MVILRLCLSVSELQTAREKISELNKQLELARIEVTSKQDEIEGLQLEVQRLKEGGSGELQALEASHKAKMDGLRKELESQTKVGQLDYCLARKQSNLCLSGIPSGR